MKLFVATHNQHKIREISQILPDFEVVPDDPEGVDENAPDFAGNALIKVRAIAARHKGEWCMADDSGLEVEALGGAPGVHSARYAGEPCDTPRNNALLLKNLEGVENRRARFSCCCALVDPEGREHVVQGHCPGRIAKKAAGVEGFGYDPLFIPDGHDKSFAELSADEKNAISHRGRALANVKSKIDNVVLGRRTSPWLQLFRVVNLPTVPGDVLVGAAAVIASVPSGICVMSGVGGPEGPWIKPVDSLPAVGWAALASVFVYMFGLAQNDIFGARTDRARPIPDGRISIAPAWSAALACLLATSATGLAAGLPRSWWTAVLALAVTATAYNKFKCWWMMGLCRALNVICGAAVVSPHWGGYDNFRSMGVAVLWWLYISLVTLYSEGEEDDPAKRRRVGLLVGGIVYLQLAALIVLTVLNPVVKPLLIAGAVLLVVLRLFKRIFPKVSAS